MDKDINLFKKFKLYFFSFILYCFIGWVYEVILEFTYGHGFVNRGFLFGPYLPVYGFGALLILFTLQSFSKKRICISKFSITPLLVFVFILLLTSIVEYIAGTALDMFFGMRLWDYTDEFLNINGLVCLEASTRFAIGGTIFLYGLQPFFVKLISKVPQKIQTFFLIFLSAILLSDFIIKLIKIL